MTLVVDRGSDGPRVHVLAIGIGAYRYLSGGTEARDHDTFGLRQLSGPPHSALAFVNWVVTKMSHPSATLGTVELLLSPQQDYGADGTTHAVELPMRANVERAFQGWYDRCDSDPNNLALFYFCGHGLEKDSSYLLLEDFGKSRLNLLENAVDIRATSHGMSRCAARTQYFFVDACREAPFGLLQMIQGSAIVLVAHEAVSDERESAVLMATSGGHRAYGRPDRPTRFTEALVRALDGLGARSDGADGWVIDYFGLQRATTALLRRSDPDAPPQRPQSYGAAGDGVLHRCPSPPVIPLAVLCDPRVAAQDPNATASLTSLDSSAAMSLGAAEGGWSAEVPADVYELVLDFAPGSYRSSRKRVWAFPPFCDIPMPVSL